MSKNFFLKKKTTYQSYHPNIEIPFNFIPKDYFLRFIKLPEFRLDCSTNENEYQKIVINMFTSYSQSNRISISIIKENFKSRVENNLLIESWKTKIENEKEEEIMEIESERIEGNGIENQETKFKIKRYIESEENKEIIARLFNCGTTEGLEEEIMFAFVIRRMNYQNTIEKEGLKNLKKRGLLK